MDRIELWKDREKRIIDPELFSKVAEDWAKKINSDRTQNGKKKDKINKRTQLRKFYDEVVRLSTLAKSRRKEWENILPMVHMLTAKAAYARGRDLISSNFMEMIRGSVEQVKEPEDLDLFANFFEAFMGFYRLYGPSN